MAYIDNISNEITKKKAELERVEKAIQTVLEAGQSASVGHSSGATTSINRASLESLQKQKADIERTLADLQYANGDAEDNHRVSGLL